MEIFALSVDIFPVLEFKVSELLVVALEVEALLMMKLAEFPKRVEIYEELKKAEREERKLEAMLPLAVMLVKVDEAKVEDPELAMLIEFKLEIFPLVEVEFVIVAFNMSRDGRERLETERLVMVALLKVALVNMELVEFKFRVLVVEALVVEALLI